MLYKLLPKSKQFLITPTTDKKISKIDSDLNIRKSTIPNSIPAKVMKQIKVITSAKLISRSFQSGVFPNILKRDKVIPVFKSESRVVCNNYRPIFLLSLERGKDNRELI